MPKQEPAVETAEEDVIDAREAPADLVSAIAAAMHEVAAVAKDRRNEDQKYDYASVEAMKAAVRGPLLTRGVALFMHPAGVESTEVTAKSGTKGERVEARFNFTFAGHDNELVIPGWVGVGIDYQDKAYSKAVTSALKTFINAQWLLPAGTEDDADGTATEYGSPRAAAPAPPAWAAEASQETKAALLNVLEDLIGHRPTAAKYASALAAKTGGFPEVVAQWLIALEQWQASGEQQGKTTVDPAPDPAKPQQPIPTPEPTAEPGGGLCGNSYRGSTTVVCVKPAGHAGPHRSAGGGAWIETMDGGGTMVYPDPIDPPPTPPAGETPPPEGINVTDGSTESLEGAAAEDATIALRAAGCICENPLKRAGDDDACPIRGHGIQF